MDVPQKAGRAITCIDGRRTFYSTGPVAFCLRLVFAYNGP